MKNKNVFQKTYTRDTTLVIQQLWVNVYNNLEQFGFRISSSPVVVDYINNGIIEIWENISEINNVKKKLINFCRRHPRRALALLNSYEREIKKLEKVWQRGGFNTKKELRKFIAKISDLVAGDLFICFIGEEARLTGRVKDKAAKLRSEDHFFVSNNSVIKKSLIKIFPKLRAYVNVFRLEDIDNPPGLKDCRQRFANFIWASDGYNRIQSLKDYSHGRKMVFQENRVKFTKLGLRGRIANKGVAVGRAKIIFSVRDLKKVKSGDIIVSPMTTADMMPAIKRAAGIITDEGGIICHAAIIAREMNKPCIIATQCSTKMLKDGDRVEVDANKGIVRKLS